MFRYQFRRQLVSVPPRDRLKEEHTGVDTRAKTSASHTIGCVDMGLWDVEDLTDEVPRKLDWDVTEM